MKTWKSRILISRKTEKKNQNLDGIPIKPVNSIKKKTVYHNEKCCRAGKGTKINTVI